MKEILRRYAPQDDSTGPVILNAAKNLRHYRAIPVISKLNPCHSERSEESPSVEELYAWRDS